jgi:hypothetical protein
MADASVGLALLLLVGGAIAFWPRADRITQENCDRIRKGMTLAEVEAILGPPGDYRNGPTDFDLPDWWATPTGVGGQAWAVWKGDHGGIYVFRYGDGDPAIASDDDPNSVSGAEFIDLKPIDRGAFADLIWRAKRLWHRWSR